MKKRERFIEHEHQRIYFVRWETPVEKPLGNLIIVHGMAEHINRYEAFAEYAMQQGYNVFGYDQRGHGFTADSKMDLGYIDVKQGWQHYISDLKNVVEHVQSVTDGKVFLLGHSMGSYVCREFTILYPDAVDGLILSGSADLKMSDLLVCLTLAKKEGMVNGVKGKAERLNMRLNGLYMKSIETPKTEYDWLSTDDNEVQKYIADPYSGFCPKVSFFVTFFGGLLSLHEKKMYKHVPVDLPMLILTGQQDPVTYMGGGTIRLFEKLQEQGVQDMRIKVYPGMRHEILNEVDKTSVFKDVIDWLHARCHTSDLNV